MNIKWVAKLEEAVLLGVNSLTQFETGATRAFSPGARVVDAVVGSGWGSVMACGNYVPCLVEEDGPNLASVAGSEASYLEGNLKPHFVFQLGTTHFFNSISEDTIILISFK